MTRSKKPTYEELERRILELEQAESELKTAEKALRESEKKYKTIIENIEDGYYEVDIAGNFTFFNDSMCNILGYSRNELTGLNSRRYMDEENAKKVFKAFNRVYQTGQSYKAFDWELIRKDGSRCYVETSVALKRDSKGQATGFQGIARDITERKRAEEALRAGEERFRLAFHTSPDSINLNRASDGMYIDINEGFTSIMGYTRDDVIGKTSISLNVWENPSDRERLVDGLSKTGFVENLEARFVGKDGKVRVGLMSARLLPINGEDVIISITRDITEIKKAELVLRKSESKMKSIFRAAPIGIGVVINRVIQDVNDRLCEISGYSRNELIGQNARIVYPSDEEYEYVGSEKYRKIKESGTGSVETRFKRKDGEIIHVLLSSTPLDPTDLSAGVTFTAMDITERKRAEGVLRISHERFLKVLNSIDATVYVADMDTYEILFMNKFMIESFGRDMTGEICWQVFRNASGPCAHCTNDQLVDENGTPTDVCVWQGVNPVTGKWYINHDRAIDWTDGRLVRLQIATDITKIKKMEEELRQAKKMESIGTLAGGIAHDFNNILAIIIGNTEMAMGDIPEWSPVNEHLKEIQSASLRAKEVVRHILSFSRKGSADRKPIKIGPIIEDSLKMLRASIPSDIEIRQNISIESDTILAEPTQMSQVLINLCANAAHAMHEGGILEVSLQNVEFGKQPVGVDLGPGRYLKLTVSDTGHGIDPKKMDRIFDPYFTTKGLGKGTGLGLSVVQGIVKAHNGAVTVKSELGKGSAFEVLFPVIEGEIEPETPGPVSLPTSNEKILFVEDEESLLNLAKKKLEMQGYRVEAKNNPVDALRLFRSGPDRFDLIITDMTMPKMTGDKLAKEVLGIRSDMPIILCSGYSDRIDAEKAVALGIRKYIEKPLDISEFVISIRKVLDEARGG